MNNMCSQIISEQWRIHRRAIVLLLMMLEGSWSCQIEIGGRLGSIVAGHNSTMAGR